MQWLVKEFLDFDENLGTLSKDQHNTFYRAKLCHICERIKKYEIIVTSLENTGVLPMKARNEDP